MAILDQLLAGAQIRRRLPEPPIRRLVRLRADLTQEDIARVVGDKAGRDVNRATIARWENGSRTPRGDLRIAYVQVLERLAAEGSNATDRPAGAGRR